MRNSITPGPGHYKDNSKAVMCRSQSASIVKPKPRKVVETDENSPFEPGKYDADKGFGAGAKVNAIQPPRQEKPKPTPLASGFDAIKAMKTTGCRVPSYAFATKPY